MKKPLTRYIARAVLFFIVLWALGVIFPAYLTFADFFWCFVAFIVVDYLTD